MRRNVYCFNIDKNTISFYKQKSIFHNHNVDMTQSQLVWSFESQGVSKILTACRMLQISIAQRQMKAKIHSFPTMYILGGGRCGRNGSNQGFRPKIRPKTRFFGGHKYWLSHFRVTWDAQFLSWRQFRCVPSKVWVKTFKMSYGHVQ